MEIINGIYTSALLHLADNPLTNIDQYARDQIAMLCNQKSLAGSRIRVMPDVHPGKVGTIGFTATVGDKLMPLLLGIDIGCGMTVAHITKGRQEWQKLDTVIRDNVPSGAAIRRSAHALSKLFDLSDLQCSDHIQTGRCLSSLGTLGGGNHFIEAGSDTAAGKTNGKGDGFYLIVHSGSRHLGKEITDYYMAKGQKLLRSMGETVPYELTWIEGRLAGSYIHDVEVGTAFASLNRHIIVQEILKGMKWKADDIWDCPHNYIDSGEETLRLFGKPILRKGAISAKEDERVVIPINMRDGVILGQGLGNADWNCSAPHGAGRIMKRENVKTSHTVSSFKAEMKGIYSSCIRKDTLDEAPFAYRNIADIMNAIGDTVKIRKILKPLYNFKACSGR